MQVIRAFAKNTLTPYCDSVDAFLFFLKEKKYFHLSQISKNTFYAYIEYYKNNPNKSLSNRSINITIASLNVFFEFLCKKYNICEATKLRQLKFISKVPNVLDESDLLNLIKKNNPIYNKEATWISYRDYALCIFLYSSGARISEALNLNTIDIDEVWVRLEETKNKNTRYAPINHYTHIVINNYKEQCPFDLCRYLWVCSKGKKLKSTAASVAIKRTFGYSPHYFRHAFATHLLLNGCSLLVIKDFLGHSSIATTSIYTHVKPKHLMATVERCHPLASHF